MKKAPAPRKTKSVKALKGLIRKPDKPISIKAMTIQSFDVSAYLDDEETIGAYLSAALEDPNPDAFLMALGNVAKARGVCFD
jgi:hypothetical protein